MRNNRSIVSPLIVIAASALGVGACEESEPVASGDACGADGMVEHCYPGPPASRGVGLCRDGTRVCGGGLWSECTGATLPATEACDGAADDNCNGVADEGCPCEAGATRACYTGPSTARGVNSCVLGAQSCEAGRWSSDCVGDVLPTAELCNGLDDDCNGIFDDGCACESGASVYCYTGPPDALAWLPCQSGLQYCSNGVWDTTCSGEVTPTAETCNLVDDDCDGSVDEDLGTTSCGVGDCMNTIASCAGGEWQPCVPLCGGEGGAGGAGGGTGGGGAPPDGPVVIIYSNYDGGDLTINVNADWPDIKIGLVSYEAMHVTIQGPYVGNVTEVHYAGYNDTPGTTITGVSSSMVTILRLPPVTLPDPNGDTHISCNYSGAPDYEGDCNTKAQVQHYFTTILGVPVYFHACQYSAWTTTQYTSAGGTCS